MIPKVGKIGRINALLHNNTRHDNGLLYRLREGVMKKETNNNGSIPIGQNVEKALCCEGIIEDGRALSNYNQNYNRGTREGILALVGRRWIAIVDKMIIEQRKG
ncbi:hypothetical protein DdX_01398 [Ditylenchus destructor]|uniref:Uncharacterized protein n=1 Tax=Ditylenchus destructor TaxID=166010 RepID=A0AAD4NLR3_9BILA|nr:hypothetical protein DdX_01398 [Ditylenchus destructor]